MIFPLPDPKEYALLGAMALSGAILHGIQHDSTWPSDKLTNGDRIGWDEESLERGTVLLYDFSPPQEGVK